MIAPTFPNSGDRFRRRRLGAWRRALTAPTSWSTCSQKRGPGANRTSTHPGLGRPDPKLSVFPLLCRRSRRTSSGH